ncbi:CASP-like protein 1F2 [Vigna radiata var. radiata]|uniref:CASP-like protein n=1 Tax=Vigna radiata var. radiata TaxID=3916 RepID=A0A1S3TUM9_VIGRR|nr:CASP-like protein 1F2 [Vigna radiata var. radiata]
MADAKDSSILNSKSSTTISQQQQRKTTKILMAQNILRLLPTLLSAASVAITVTNSQTVFIFALRFEAHFYYSPSLKFFVAANSVVAAISFLTLIANCLIKRQPSPKYNFFILLHDMVMTVVLIAGCAAATSIGYVGQFGEKHVGWQPICDHVTKFCRRNLVSLLLSYFAFIAYFAVTILSAYISLFSSPNKTSQNEAHHTT